MSRFSFASLLLRGRHPLARLAVITCGLSFGLSTSGLSLFGCGSSDVTTTSTATDAGSLRRDATPVTPTEAGPAPYDGNLAPPPSCQSYCNLVMANCKGSTAQYGSTEECLDFCAHLPLVQPVSEGDEKSSATVACRQYWADTPARTSPQTYCLAAGPFGGNICGDRCTAFCSVLLDTCSPDGGVTAYTSQPECATACTEFAYRDAGLDGGGEGPDGPDGGDTLNCRLYWLRAATTDSEKCELLRPQSDVCKQ